MSKSYSIFDDVFAVSKIQRSDLMGFTVYELNQLLGYSSLSDLPKGKVGELIKRLNIQDIGTAEQTLIQEVRTELSIGISGALNFEERALPRGGSVSYSPETITIKPKKGSPAIIPNLPVAPPGPVKKKGMDKLVPLIVANMHIVAGELVLIRDAHLDNQFFGSPDTLYDYTKVKQLQTVLAKVMRAHDADVVFKPTVTKRGYAFVDYLYGLLDRLDTENYLALHFFAVGCFPDLQVEKNEAGIRVPRIKKVGDTTRLPRDIVTAPSGVDFPDAKKILESRKVAPFLWTKPVPAKAYIESPVNSESLIRLQQHVITVSGGKSSGMGLIYNTLDYCPRQSPVTRRMNFFLMALDNVKKAKGKEDAPVDIHVLPGDVPFLSTFLDREIMAGHSTDVKLVLPRVKSKSINSKHVIYNPRSAAVQIMSPTYLRLPEVVKEKKRDSAKVNEAAAALEAAAFSSILGEHSEVFVLAQWYHPNQCIRPNKSDPPLKTIPIGHMHDINVVFTNVCSVLYDTNGEEWKKPIDWKLFLGEAEKGMRRIIGWFLAPAPIYNDLGTWWRNDGTRYKLVNDEWIADSEININVDLGPGEESTYEDLPILSQMSGSMGHVTAAQKDSAQNRINENSSIGANERNKKISEVARDESYVDVFSVDAFDAPPVVDSVEDRKRDIEKRKKLVEDSQGQGYDEEDA